MATILGIETSCDETAAAVVTGDGEIRANIVASQADLQRLALQKLKARLARG